ncbi:MAG: hypothetical protein AAGG09_18280 [Pseudomonadota bacterium]
MPMEAEDLAEMEGLIAVARKRELNFAICLGKKPEGTIFLMHRKKDGTILARNAKKAGESPKLAWGTCSVKGKKINLTCAEDPPPNTARAMKMFLKDQGFPFKVVILDALGNEIESDGEDDEQEADGITADAPELDVEESQLGQPTLGEEQEEEVNALAEQWNSRVGPLGDLYTEAMGTNPPNRTQLEAAWGMANEKADAGDFKAAITIADKLEPALKNLAETTQAKSDADKLREKFDAALPKLQQLHEAAIAAEPPNLDQLSAAWEAMMRKAGEGDYKMALATAAKLMPALQAAAAGDPNSAPWFKLEGELTPLYVAAMKTNPPDGTKLQAAWGMATEKAEAKDYAGAIKIGERLKPLLEAAAKAKDTASEIPKNVVAFQKSRVLWSKTRETMYSEMKKLEDSIKSMVSSDPELSAIGDNVGLLSDRLKPFDTRLEDILDAITNEADGEARERLKQEAIAKINEYKTELSSEFFQDVDSNNGFMGVSVRTAANNSLDSIAKVLAS